MFDKHIFQSAAAAVVILLCITTGRTARGQQYSGKVLYPMDPLPDFEQTHLSDSVEAAGGGQTVGSATRGPLSFTTTHAVLWTSPTGQFVDLTPANSNAVATGTDGTHQVGYSGSTGTHATLWSGTADSAMDLHPTNLPGVFSSIAYGVKGGQQVGIGYLNNAQTGFVVHALLWNGTADSAVDLNPSIFENSRSLATDGLHQVGSGYNTGVRNEHALLWSGSASSVVDLHPSDLSSIQESVAYGVGGGQQVGLGVTPDGLTRAIVWNGSANSAVELHPAGFDSSTAYGTNGIYQVGFGSFEGDLGGIPSNIHHALLWNGSAASVVDLNSLLPFSPADSEAYTIDAQGNIFGVANGYAVEWSPVPEPAGGVLGAIGLAMMIAVGCLKRAG